jgi:glycosyltransferase involved in cell wall biosynthesis
MNVVSEDMKLCFVLNFAPHYRKEIYLLIEKELKATFYFADDTLAKNLKKIDYGVFQNKPIELKFVRLFKNFNWIKGMAQLPLSNSYNKFVVTGEPFCLSSWLMLFVARFKKKQVYAWTHGMHGNEVGVKKLFKILYFKLFSGIFLYGDYARKLMIGHGFAPEKMNTIFNSLHYSIQLNLRKELSLEINFAQYFKKDLPVIIFIGRLRPQKKIPLLFEALNYSIRQFGVPFNIFLIGDGSEHDFLKQIVNKLSICDYVFFYGECYDEVVIANFIYNADLCVSPGEIGLTAVHTLGYGTPVITHNNFSDQMPEFEAIIDGLNGSFFDQNDSSSLATVINDWLNNHPKKSNDLSQECFKVIDERYNPFYQINIFKRVLV